MTDKELRRLGRPELIDIIYQLEKRQEENTQEIARLQAQLQDRSLRLSEAGSIAQAALQVNGVMEAAQAAADQYVQAAEAARDQAQTELADAKTQADAILADAQTRADAILSDAQAQAQTVTAQAEQEARNHWDLFQEKAEQLIREHRELSALLNREDPS